jgi:hypothetical protein
VIHGCLAIPFGRRTVRLMSNLKSILTSSVRYTRLVDGFGKPKVGSGRVGLGLGSYII